MDPFSVLVAVGTTLQVVKEVWKGLQWMQHVYEIHTEGDRTLQQMALECSIYAESIKSIGYWLKRNQNATGLTRQIRTTHNAITLVQVSMANVLLDMKKFEVSGKQKVVKDTRLSKEKQNLKLFQQFVTNKAKLQWFAETMKGHLSEVRAHAATLHLTLGVIDLAGNTTNQQEKAPERLEAKTGRLERRLMLRRFMTKALEIKRAEIAELSGAAQAGQTPSKTLPGSVEMSPQKLTFYDVVQLARQQASAEKTRKANEDLIDLSGTSQELLNLPVLTSVQSDLALIDFSHTMPSPQISPRSSCQNNTGPIELDSTRGTEEIQPIVAELDACTPLHPPNVDLIGLVELDASPVNRLDKKEPIEPIALAELTNQSSSQSHEPSETRIKQYKNTDDQPGLEVVGTEVALVDGSDTKESIESASTPATVDQPSIPEQPSAARISIQDQIDEAPDDESLASSAAPSIFSHTSSSTSATGCSLPGIAEEDVQTQLVDINKPDEQGFPWIVKAAHDGNEDLVRKLLLSGADIQATQTSTQRHALTEASLQGHQKIVDLLIKEGCSLESTDAEENTALHHACQNGHLAVAKSLITATTKERKNAFLNAKGSEGQSALHLAMEAPYRNVVMLLVQHNANVNARDASSRTPLHIAAGKGNLAMCTYLLDEGAQLDIREAQSKTPLQLACEAGYYELAQMMLDHSKLNPTNMTFLTAFFAAVEHGHVRIAEAFFAQGLKLQELKKDRHKPLITAAKSGCLAMVELMIQEDCDINTRDDNGWNALHFASYHGHYQVIERLFASGVPTKATTSRKETPLLFAVKGTHFPVVEQLLRNDNDSSLVSAEDERGQQLVHHAVRAGSLQIFNLLMSNGAKINVENSFGWQPLHIATAYGHLSLVERLLQQGANIEEKLGSSSIKKDQTHKLVEEGCWAEARWPYSGSRALHLACEYGHGDIANLLIRKGAKLEVSCSEGWQPLHHATYFGSSTLVETLLQGGVNPHAVTNEGKTASTLGFCTTGTPIPEEETGRIRDLLKEAMNRVKKQKNFKVALKKSSTVEDKSKLLRAAIFSMMMVSRSDTDSTRSDTPSSLQRPRLQRPPYTSPLPMKGSPPDSNANEPSNPSLPASQMEVKPEVVPSATDKRRESADTVALEVSSVALTVSKSNTSQGPQSSRADATDKTPAPSVESQLSTQPMPKLQRRTTFGFAKVDMGKLSLASMGKPTFEIGKQTFDIGNKTLELGKQGFEISKQRLGKSRQGLEMGKKGIEAIQGLEVGGMGKKGVDMSKQGYKNVKKFARKGKLGKGEKSKAGGSVEGSKESGKAEEGVADINEDEDDGSDDAKSVFSLGDFAELGSKDF